MYIFFFKSRGTSKFFEQKSSYLQPRGYYHMARHPAATWSGGWSRALVIPQSQQRDLCEKGTVSNTC